jgi:hypothetical protein
MTDREARRARDAAPESPPADRCPRCLVSDDQGDETEDVTRTLHRLVWNPVHGPSHLR